ncbi:MAG TPA: hypothetical protein VE932_14270 [Patescibacteria group bacterium]|nr:hypothetical protein [Patescibacteria group bacterium]
MRVGVAAAVLAALMSLLPPASAAQTAADYYWWKALERAERGDLAEAGEDLRSAARSTSDPEFAFAVTSTLLDVDTGLALAEYARSLRRANRNHDATVLEQRVALFLQAKFGRSREASSVYLGFSPIELLTEYASDLRQLGSSDEARRIDDMAERYRQVQAEHFRRLQQRPR